MTPIKPTRDDAAASSRPEEMYDGKLPGAGKSAPQGQEAARDEKGSAEGSRRHPPHATINDREGDVQGDETAAAESAALPANAPGTDRLSSNAQDRGIQEGSMYEGRRDEDKDRPPSTRTDE